ncbi:Symplekin C-terminal domain-containing protein [Entamoeba marina]
MSKTPITYIDEFTNLIEKSFGNGGEQQLSIAIDKLRKGDRSQLKVICSSLQYVPDIYIEKQHERLINTFKALPETTIDPFLCLVTRMIPMTQLRSEGQNIIKTIIIPRVIKNPTSQTLHRIVSAFDAEIITGSAITRITEAAWSVGVNEGVLLTSRSKQNIWEVVNQRSFISQEQKHEALIAAVQYGNVCIKNVLDYINELVGNCDKINQLGLTERADVFEKIVWVHQLLLIIINKYKMALAPCANHILNVLLKHIALINVLPPISLNAICSTILSFAQNIPGSLLSHTQIILSIFDSFIQKNSSQRYHPVILQIRLILNLIEEQYSYNLTKEEFELLKKLLVIID